METVYEMIPEFSFDPVKSTHLTMNFIPIIWHSRCTNGNRIIIFSPLFLKIKLYLYFSRILLILITNFQVILFHYCLIYSPCAGREGVFDTSLSRKIFFGKIRHAVIKVTSFLPYIKSMKRS